jgi:hypothetical protein
MTLYLTESVVSSPLTNTVDPHNPSQFCVLLLNSSTETVCCRFAAKRKKIEERERERERESVYVCVCVCVSVSQRPVCVLSGSGVFLCPAHIKYLYHKRDDRLGCLCPEVIIFVFLLRCFSFTKERA